MDKENGIANTTKRDKRKKSGDKSESPMELPLKKPKGQNTNYNYHCDTILSVINDENV